MDNLLSGNEYHHDWSGAIKATLREEYRMIMEDDTFSLFSAMIIFSSGDKTCIKWKSGLGDCNLFKQNPITGNYSLWFYLCPFYLLNGVLKNTDKFSFGISRNCINRYNGYLYPNLL